MYGNNFESHDGYVFTDECSYYKYLANWEDYPYGPIGLGATKVRSDSVNKHDNSSNEYQHDNMVYAPKEVSYETFEVEIVARTKKARLVSDGIGEFWIPRTYVVEYKSKVIACVPEWLKIKYLKEQNLDVLDDFEVLNG